MGRERRDFAWADVLRVAAILAVVVIHASGPLVKTAEVGSRTWWFAVLSDAGCSWAVPVFAMLSGALLLGRSRVESLSSFYRRRFLRVGLPAIAWIIAYFVFRRQYLSENLTVRQYAEQTLSGFPYFHLYFVFVVLGLYAVTPLLRVFLAHASWREALLATGGALFLAWANQLGLTFLRIGSNATALTFFLPYLGYFLLGYLLRDVQVSGRTARLAAVGFVVAWLAQGVEAYWLQSSHHIRVWLYPLTKFSETTMLMAVCVVLLGKVLSPRLTRGDASRRLWKRGAEASFAVYLAHPMVLAYLARETWLGPQVSSGPELVSVVLITAVVTFAAGLVATRVPVLRRLV